MRSAVLTAFIIATALFMENMDGTVISTSLPAIALDLHQDPIVLKLALTSYMLTLAVFIPASGWVADRFGARTVFCTAIVVFTLGSILCGASSSLRTLIAARVFQGLGGAMMVPVGRLVLLRSVQKSELVDALAYLTVPALLGPVAGPPLGGFITTYFNWRWIFWINVPIGVLGVLLSLRFIANLREEEVPRFDFKGFVLSGVGLLSLISGLSAIGRGIAPFWTVAAMIVVGAAALFAYARHAGANEDAILDLKLLENPDLLFRRGRRPPVPRRHRRPALPAAAPPANRLRTDAVRVRLADLRHRRRLHCDEIHRLDRAALARLPPDARRQRAHFRRVHGVLCALHALDAALDDLSDAFGRRLLPLARIHRPQRHQLRRHRPAADEPRHELRQRLAADVGRGRRRRRRHLHSGHPGRLRRPDPPFPRSLDRLRAGGDRLEPLDPHLRPAEAGRRRRARRAGSRRRRKAQPPRRSEGASDAARRRRRAMGGHIWRGSRRPGSSTLGRPGRSRWPVPRTPARICGRRRRTSIPPARRASGSGIHSR